LALRANDRLSIFQPVTTDLKTQLRHPQGAPFRGDARIRLLRVFSCSCPRRPRGHL
jgi:hypothetical protein